MNAVVGVSASSIIYFNDQTTNAEHQQPTTLKINQSRLLMISKWASSSIKCVQAEIPTTANKKIPDEIFHRGFLFSFKFIIHNYLLYLCYAFVS